MRLAQFDPLDMSNQLETSQLCSKLFTVIAALKEHSMNSLSEVIRYSYIMSLETYVETSQISDYGRCEEAEAEKGTFCLDFFEWPTQFSLWSSD